MASKPKMHVSSNFNFHNLNYHANQINQLRQFRWELLGEPQLFHFDYR